jgi:competence protein ComEC
MTLKGKVTGVVPATYSRWFVRIRVSEILGRKTENANFLLDVPFTHSDIPSEGDEVIVRSTVGMPQNPSPSSLHGRAALSGWITTDRKANCIKTGRTRLSRAIDRYGERETSGLLASITLGQRWRVGTRTRDILRKTGTYHLLAVSGVHIGASILPILLLFRLCTVLFRGSDPSLNRKVMLLVSAMTVGTYLLFTGMSSSALRALVFVYVTGSAVLFARNTAPLISLSWCIPIIVFFGHTRQPDTAFLLSVTAAAGLILSVQGTGRGRARNILVKSFRVTLGATLFTIPLGVWLSNGLSYISPLGNLAAGVPFGLVLIPSAVLLDFVSLLPRFPIEAVISIWLKIADPVMSTMTFLSDLPFSFRSLSTPGCAVASLSAAAGIPVWMRCRYSVRSGLAVYFLVITLAGGADLLWQRALSDKLLICFPAAGQADAAVIRHGCNTVLIDCGPPGLPGRKAVVARILQKLGVRKIDALFLSHAHPDHAGGLQDIVTLMPVKKVYLPDHQETVRQVKKMIASRVPEAGIITLRYGDSVDISSVSYKVVGPAGLRPGERDMNRASMQVLVKAGGYRALFTGDAGWDQVAASLENIRSLDLIKIPHHGSKKGFVPHGLPAAFVRLTKKGPVFAVCTAETPGMRDLPAPEVVQWFEEKGIMLVYTGNNEVNISCDILSKKGNGAAVVDNHRWF